MDHDQPALPPDSPLMTMTNSFLNDGMLLGLSISGPRLPYRDSTYYINDGNSVLLVENTLFKVRTLHALCIQGYERLMVGGCVVNGGAVHIVMYAPL